MLCGPLSTYSNGQRASQAVQCEVTQQPICYTTHVQILLFICQRGMCFSQMLLKIDDVSLKTVNALHR